jgi:2'-5' RNA ligase
MSDIIYSLWFKPTGRTFEVLTEVVERFARESGATPFEPHVTLLGNLDGTEAEIVRRSEDLARTLRRFEIELTEAAFGQEHFQCVFMRVRETPAVMGANSQARQAFNQAPGRYMPHLSLVYGSLPDARKREIVARLPDLSLSFEAETVYVIRADTDDPEDWHEVGSYPIGA